MSPIRSRHLGIGAAANAALCGVATPGAVAGSPATAAMQRASTSLL